MNAISTNPVPATTRNAPLQQTDPQEVARRIVADARGPHDTLDHGEVLRGLDAVAQQDSRLAAQVEAAVREQLGAREFGRVLSASYVVGEGPNALVISRNAPSLQSYYNGTALPGDAGASRAHYARLDRLFGDGDPRSFDGPRIEAGIAEMIGRGLALADLERMGQAANDGGIDPETMTLIADLGQMTLDIVGIFDQTGLSDGANALISAGRGDWIGAGLSVLAIVPVVGGLAVAGKLGKWAETVGKAVDLALTNSAARRALEPALRRLDDALKAIPDAVMRNLPDSLRETLEGIGSKLDELFAAGAGRRALSALSVDELAQGLARATGPEIAEFASELARRSTHGSGDRVVLGKWPGYIDEATANGGVYFSTPNGVFQTLEAELGAAAGDRVWQINQAFLDQQMQRGVSKIEFTQEGIEHAMRNEQSFSARELNYLSERAGDYGYRPNGNAFER